MNFDGVFQVQFCSGIILCKENKKYMLISMFFLWLQCWWNWFFSHCCCYVENCISLILKCHIMLFLFKSNVFNLDVFFFSFLVPILCSLKIHISYFIAFMFLYSNRGVNILFFFYWIYNCLGFFICVPLLCWCLS